MLHLFSWKCKFNFNFVQFMFPFEIHICGSILKAYRSPEALFRPLSNFWPPLKLANKLWGTLSRPYVCLQDNIQLPTLSTFLVFAFTFNKFDMNLFVFAFTFNKYDMNLFVQKVLSKFLTITKLIRNSNLANFWLLCLCVIDVLFVCFLDFLFVKLSLGANVCS